MMRRGTMGGLGPDEGRRSERRDARAERSGKGIERGERRGEVGERKCQLERNLSVVVLKEGTTLSARRAAASPASMGRLTMTRAQAPLLIFLHTPPSTGGLALHYAPSLPLLSRSRAHTYHDHLPSARLPSHVALWCVTVLSLRPCSSAAWHAAWLHRDCELRAQR